VQAAMPNTENSAATTVEVSLPNIAPVGAGLLRDRAGRGQFQPESRFDGVRYGYRAPRSTPTSTTCT
jgi:hypothetical protein